MKGRFWRKALAAALALLVVSGNVPIKPVADLFGSTAITASAIRTETSGQCGENATWVYDRAIGKLTISGTGAMYNYHDNQPWRNYMDNITSVEIENGITSIGDSAFNSCEALTSITIPDSVESISDFAFMGCTSLKSITIPEKVTSISDFAFYYCTSLTSVTIPKKVTSIGDSAFFYCTSLTSVTIPEKVTSIGEAAFGCCTRLESITIPEKVTSIGGLAFAKCTGLTSITIPDSVTSIGADAFYGCTGITDVSCNADPNALTWDNGDCDDFKSDGTTVCHVPAKYYLQYVKKFGAESENPVNVTFDTDAPHGQCGENAYWSLASGTLTISGTGNMDSVGWAKYKDEIAFVFIGDGITSICDSAFAYCSNLPSVEIPDSVESIGNDAFSGCTRLTSIEIPDSVTNIGADAFFGCTNITDVYCYADPKNLTWNEGDCDDFIKAPKHTTVCHVPVKYLETYEENFGNVNVRFVGDLVDMGLGEHLYGHSITLDGGIGVNFYVELTDELLASETAEMVFTVPNGSKTDTQMLLVKNVIAESSNKVVIGSKTYYKFRCSISAKDMASTITAQLVDGEKSGKEYTYSVKEYAEYLLSHTEVKEYAKAAPLVKAMLNYGAASQTYFGIEGTAANASLSDTDKALVDVTIPETFIKFNEVNAALPEGVTFEGATLSLRSETTLSLYFKGLADGTEFTCNDKNVETAKNGNYVVARIRGIKASELENDFTVTFKGGSVKYNAMTYCYNVLNDGTVDDNLKNVCKALYKYAQAAKTYSE